MAITPITQVISETITPPTDLILASDVIPSDPNSVDAFVSAAESAFNVLTNDTVPDMQTVAEEINTVSSQMNVLAGQVDTLATTVQESANIAIASANYKGDWVAGYNTTGYSLNMSVSYTDGYNYVSKINNNLIEPTSKTNTAEWNFIEAVNPNDYYDKTEIDDFLTEIDFALIERNNYFSKQNKKTVVFTKTAPAGFSVLPNKVELPNGTIANNTNTVSLSLNSNLDTGSKVAGTDYYVYCTASNTYNISTNKTKTDGTIIGGFHYGLTTESESPTGNKTEADMVQIRGINSYSFWDLKYRPNNENTNAMVKIGDSWYDIYQMDSEYGINKYSRAGATIAGGTTEYGRAIPKIPLAYGGNGTVTYGKFTWFQAGEVAVASGKRKISYNEFGSIAYGVTEGVSSSINGYESIAGKIEHYPHLTSKYGIEQASGVQYIWGADVGGNYGTTDWAWRNNTDTRGQIYSTSNNPTAVILGGSRGDGADAGSRASSWNHYVWVSHWYVGCRFACDHLELV